MEDPEAATRTYDPTTMRARARVGLVLREKWRLDGLLGVGGMAAVYAATHRNGSRVAIKLLHTELTINAQIRSRFLREGYVANAVAHEGAVKIIDDDTAEDGSLFLVTELLDGETLEGRRLRRGGQLSEDDVLCVTDQLLEVLAAAHANRIVHRDIKPENVFLTRSGQVKVLDFGIARMRELSSASTATKSGASMGTPAYMPPEQARGLWDEVDARSDLWAVGATMFHLLSGRLVHVGRTTNEMLLCAMTKSAPELASVAPNIAPSVSHVVDRALAFGRENRWPDAHRMQEGVRHAYHDRHGAPLTTAPKLTVPPEVPNGTLPSTSVRIVPSLPTTGEPVERHQVMSLRHVGSRRWLVPATFGAAATVGIVAPVAIAVLGRHGGAPLSGGLPSLAPAPEVVTTTTPSASAAASGWPTIAATDLPTVSTPTSMPSGRSRTAPATTTTRAAAASAAPQPTTTTPPPLPAAKPTCPVDPVTGKTRYSEDCVP